MASSAVVHTAGSLIWIKDGVESWKKAEVVRVDKDELVLKTESGQELKCKAEDAPLQNPGTRGVEVIRGFGL
jgi:hypothetical protein